MRKTIIRPNGGTWCPRRSGAKPPKGSNSPPDLTGDRVGETLEARAPVVLHRRTPVGRRACRGVLETASAAPKPDSGPSSALLQPQHLPRKTTPRGPTSRDAAYQTPCRSLSVEDPGMAKALLGHIGGTDPRMVAEMRRLQQRVRDLEDQLVRVQAENDSLAAAVQTTSLDHELFATTVAEREPALT